MLYTRLRLFAYIYIYIYTCIDYIDPTVVSYYNNIHTIHNNIKSSIIIYYTCRLSTLQHNNIYVGSVRISNGGYAAWLQDKTGRKRTPAKRLLTRQIVENILFLHNIVYLCVCVQCGRGSMLRGLPED